MRRRLLQLGLGMAVSGVLIALLARTIDTGAVGSAIARVDVRLILAAIAIHLLAMFVRAVLWRRLLSIPTSTALLFKVSIVGFAVSYIMPLRVGEIARAYLMARWRGIAYGATLASLVAERVLDGLAVVAILLVALLFVPAPAYVLALGVAVAAIFGGLASVLIIVSWRPGAVVASASVLGRHLPWRMRGAVDNLAHGFASGLEPLRDWRALPGLAALALVGWLCQFAVFYFVMLAFALPSSIPVALLGGSVANFATLLPSAPGNVGTFDAAIIRLLIDIQGTSLDSAAAYALVVHAVVVVPIVILGGLILWRSDLTLTQVLGRSTSAASPTGAVRAQPVLNAGPTAS